MARAGPRGGWREAIECAHRQPTHEKVVEVHQVSDLAGDEERRANDDHQYVVQPVDELQVAEEEHVVAVHREDERCRPVVDRLPLHESIKRVGADGVEIGEAEQRDPAVGNHVQRKPPRLRVTRVE